MHSSDDSGRMSGVVAKVAAVGRKWCRCKCKFARRGIEPVRSRRVTLIILSRRTEDGMK